MHNTTFGQRIQRLRDKRGLTQDELARRVGVHVQTISKIERGLHDPGTNLTLRIAQALGVKIGVLFSERKSLSS